MFINTTIEVETGDDVVKVDVEGRFYNGYLEDWYADTALPIDTATAEFAVQKLYDEYRSVT